ncbi:MAG: Card1-like endonuclease domain-containing protein [Lacibacter sp.]
MMRTIICLLSEQPIPNLLFIRHMYKPGDSFLFLSTDEMEKRFKSKALLEALGFHNRPDVAVKVETIPPYAPAAIYAKLQSLLAGKAGLHLIVNITGGTKIMSQVAFQFFTTLPQSEIYYWPDSNDRLLRLYPDLADMPLPSLPLINLEDYLRAHGYSYTYLPMQRSRNDAEYYWNKVLKAGDVRQVPELEKARNNNYTHADKPYLTGGWFEEWLHYRLQEHYRLADDQIGLSVQLHDVHGSRPEVPSRELDVVYVHNHSLYIWEAKVYTMNAIKNAVIIKDLFKLSAIRNTLGLKAQAHFAVAAKIYNNEQRSTTLKELARTLNLQRIWDLDTLETLLQ